MKKAKQPTSSEIEDVCERLWAALVKARAGYKCEFSQRTSGLHSHHLFKRVTRDAKFDLDNGICLCAGVHNNFHHMGVKVYRDHMFRAIQIVKARGVDLVAVGRKILEGKRHLTKRPMMEYFDTLYSVYLDYMNRGLLRVEVTIPPHILEKYEQVYKA